jgi:hypothetical protein
LFGFVQAPLLGGLFVNHAGAASALIDLRWVQVDFASHRFNGRTALL